MTTRRVSKGRARIRASAAGNNIEELWLPKKKTDLFALPPECVLQDDPNYAGQVYRTQKGVVIKTRADFTEEILAMNFARRHTSIPVPRVLHYPRSSNKVWYLCMEEARGVSLNKTLETMTTEQLDHIASQLKWVLAELRKVKPQAIGSVSGGPFRNPYFPCHPEIRPKYAFPTYREFIEYFRELLLVWCTPQWTNQLLARFPVNASIVFTHSDLLPRNIMVEGSTITAIIDWELAGFYPEFWEYCKMHDHFPESEKWNHILSKVFPGVPLEQRAEEYAAVGILNSAIQHSLLAMFGSELMLRELGHV